MGARVGISASSCVNCLCTLSLSAADHSVNLRVLVPLIFLHTRCPMCPDSTSTCLALLSAHSQAAPSQLTDIAHLSTMLCTLTVFQGQSEGGRLYKATRGSGYL